MRQVPRFLDSQLLRKIGTAFVLLAVSLHTPGCLSSSSDVDCPVGSEGCACTDGGSCDAGLRCAPSSETCYLAGAAGSSNEPSSGATAGTESGSGATAGTESSSGAGAGGSHAGTGGSGATAGMTGVSSCEAEGGTLLPDGFCFKNCTYDDLSPGHDLFGDCASVRGVCVSDFTTLKSSPSYCRPASWNSQCGSNADCGAGAKCVQSGSSSYCKIACDSSTECGTLRCVQGCASGYFDQVAFCHDNYGFPPTFSEPSLCSEG